MADNDMTNGEVRRRLDTLEHNMATQGEALVQTDRRVLALELNGKQLEALQKSVETLTEKVNKMVLLISVLAAAGGAGTYKLFEMLFKL